MTPVEEAWQTIKQIPEIASANSPDGVILAIRRRVEAAIAREAQQPLRDALERLLSHYTTRPHCGHTFTCICKDNDIAAARRALEAR